MTLSCKVTTMLHRSSVKFQGNYTKFACIHVGKVCIPHIDFAQQFAWEEYRFVQDVTCAPEPKAV